MIAMFSLLFLTLHILITTAVSHQSIAYPPSISYARSCRVGNGRNCPGPCPRKAIRKGVTPNNPHVTVRRGGYLGVKIFKNNHVGGFARWSLVKLKDMHSHRKHRKGAFLYSCADRGVTKCNNRNKKDLCPGDKRNEYYKHVLHIPEIYDDGVYVLGWAWYGGLTKKQKFGFFGDYYDCTYVRIQGGPFKGSHRVTFRVGTSLTGRGGKCKAMVNRLGPCRREFCKGKGPRGYRPGSYMVPAEFSRNRRPKKLTRVRSGGRRNRM